MKRRQWLREEKERLRGSLGPAPDAPKARNLPKWRQLIPISFVFFSLGLLHGASVAWPAGAIEASFDKTKVTVGEPFVYTVKLSLPPGAQAQLPGEKAVFKGLEVRGYEPQEIPQADGSRQIVLRYTLVAFDTGVARIKDFRVPVRLANGTTERWLAPPLEITVASVLPEKGPVPPKGFVGPIMLGGGWGRWLWAALAALVLAILVGAILYRRRKQAAPLTSETTMPLPPDETALAALRRLQAEDLIARGEFALYYRRLAEILRAWLEARFDIPALKRTTTGIMYFLRVRREAEAWRADVLELLRTADRVKFADLPPQDNEAAEHLEQAQRVIEAARAALAEAEEEETARTASAAAEEGKRR